MSQPEEIQADDNALRKPLLTRKEAPSSYTDDDGQMVNIHQDAALESTPPEAPEVDADQPPAIEVSDGSAVRPTRRYSNPDVSLSATDFLSSAKQNAKYPTPSRTQPPPEIPSEFVEDGIQTRNFLFADTPESLVMQPSAIFSARKTRIKRVSNYILGAVLGEGAFGIVRDAIDITQRMRVAVKVVRKKFRKQSELRIIQAQLINEVEYLQRFHHPCVIRAIDIFCSAQGKDYIVLPVAVCSLQQLIMVREDAVLRANAASGVSNASSRFLTRAQSMAAEMSALHFSKNRLLPHTLVKDIIGMVLSGLVYMHNQGIYHNDIKPDNVLIFRDGSVKLSDLGACGPKYKGRGTPAYVSPQMAAAEEEVSAEKNDVWACGVLLYYMLSGYVPFNAPNEFAMYREICTKPVDFTCIPQTDRDDLSGSSSVHSDLGSPRDLVQHMLDKDEKKRFTAADALMHPWLSSVYHELLNPANCTEGDGSESLVASSRSLPPDGSHRSPTSTARRLEVPSPKRSSIGSPPHNIKKVFNVREISDTINHDRLRHFAFVEEIADVMRIQIAEASKKKRLHNSDQNLKIVASQRAQSLSNNDPDYYAKKGKFEKDIRSLRMDPVKIANLAEYCRYVLAGTPLRGPSNENAYPDVLLDDDEEEEPCCKKCHMM